MKANVSENSGGWRRPTPLPGVWGTGKGGSTSAAATAVAAQILIAATRGAATPPWRESPPISEDASAPQRDATPSDSIPIGTVFEARF